MDRALKELEREELRRARLAKLREYRLESEKRVRDLEKELKSSSNENSSTSIADIEAAKMLAELPEEQRKKVLAVYSALKSAGRGESASMLIPLTISSVLSNPNASVDKTASVVLQTIEYVNRLIGERRESGSNISELIKGVAELIREISPKTGGGMDEDLKEAYKTFMRAAVDYYMNPPRPRTWLDEILEDPKKLEIVQRIFGGGKEKDTEYLKLLREMKRDEKEFQMMLKKLDLDTKLKLLQMRAEAEKRAAVERGFKRLIAAASEALGETGEEEEEVKGKAEREESVREGKTGKPKIETIICDECGAEIKVAPDAKVIVCPKCGAKYSKKAE